MKKIETFYKGILRCQFSTQRAREYGKEHRTIFRHIVLEPTFELFALEEITEKTYNAHLKKFQDKPFLHHLRSELVDYYDPELAPDGKRMYTDSIFMGINTEPQIIDHRAWDWNDFRFDAIPPKFLHECFLAYNPNANYGRIGGPVVLKRVQNKDEKGQVVFGKADTVSTREVLLEKQGCFQESRGCTRRIFGFNLGLKNWMNSIFGGIFGSSIIGSEPNGCLPSLFPSGCSGVGCQRFGCGILSLIAALAFLLWLFRCLLFGDCGNASSNKERVVERIVHDTVYINKNPKVDTLTFVDETTNSTIKMISLPNVQFEKNKAILLRSSIPQLNELAAYLNENNEIYAEIIGHTDSDGNYDANKALSKNRAETVRKYLIKNGVDGKRIKATGKGESEPVTENATAEGRAMNRRVEVKLSEMSTTKTTRTKKELRQE